MSQSSKDQRRANPTSSATTRDSLVHATRECVRRSGIAGTTSRQIAATADVNLGSITYYFGSKDALVAEALFGELEGRLAAVLDALDSEQPAATRLLNAVQQVVVEFEQSADDVPVYLNALMLGTEEGPMAERAAELLADVRTRLAHVIEILVAEGVVSNWVSPDAMAALIIAAANGMALQTRLEPQGADMASMAGQLAGLLLAASATL